MSAIFGFFISEGPPAECDGRLSGKTSPFTSSVSSIVPPIFFTILMSRRSTLVAVFGSMILLMASTASGANPALEATTFDASEVVTQLVSCSLFARSTGIASSFRKSKALSSASWKASDI